MALVGPSGGGKSTLSDLIPRFYDVTSGAIFVDGIDLREYQLDSLRSHMGIVTQETILFNDTIAGNIRLGKRDATDAEVEAAARVANADGFIRETEHGYDTNVGDRGMKLSGGSASASASRARCSKPRHPVLDRGHFGTRYRIGKARAGGPRFAAQGAHVAGNRAPPEHDRGRRQDHRD